MSCRSVVPLLLVFLAVLPQAGVHAQSQVELNEMAEKDFQHADARLNVIYRQAYASLDAVGRAKLEKSERAWIAYREAEADLEADESRGGSIALMIYASTQTQLTNARIKALRQFRDEMRGQ